MKNPMKRIVPILLALAVIGCAVWYLFVYDRDFARDMMISQARFLDDAGHHEIAAWLYDQAYIYTDKDASVAIELAQQYKENGNYTKAEYTLTKAIASEPAPELYIALSQIFVEQDKLLDAVNLLDKIADPAMKQTLDAMRPVVPAVSIPSNFYSEYLSVELTGEDGTLYFSTDNEYPSIVEDPYTGAIALGLGETTIYALTVGENGLVSPLGIYGYTIGGVVESVTFVDSAMEAEIRNILGFDGETVIYTDDLWTITELTLPSNAQSYDDLSKLTNLTSLSVQNPETDDFDSLSALTQLQELFIAGCDISQQSLTVIASLPALKELTLANCDLTNISPLSAAVGLEYLDLSYNSIRDISSLSAMSALKTLYMTNNALTDLSALSGLSQLSTLNVSHNSITSIEPICNNSGLEKLYVHHNLLKNLASIDHLPALSKLDAGYNDLTDVSVLGDCTALTELNISNNKIEDISALVTLSSLLEFHCSYNEITSLPNWADSIALVTIDASYNRLSDLTPLSGLQSLNNVNVDYNAGITTVEPLATCPNLIEVNLFGTKVTNIDSLTQQSIIVHYNPTDVNVEITEPTEPEE